MSLFVSYTRVDELLVRKIRDDLERLGRSVWMDHQIHGGESWWREIIQEIQRAEIFVFALSNHSWRSKPCRLELRYAEKLGIPVLPLQVGPLDSMFIPLAEKQIIDYRERSADAVVRLVAALTELTARPVVLPDPLPDPPEVPFEYLYRIASLLGPDLITPEAQDHLIAQLRSKLKEEDDDVAKADIVKLLKELAGRGELTVRNAREIEEILAGVVAKSVPAPDGGATRLPPVWRPGETDVDQAAAESVAESAAVSGGGAAEVAAESEVDTGEAEPPEPPEPRPEPEPPAAETTRHGTGTVPSWLADIVRTGGATSDPEPPSGGRQPPPSGWWSQQNPSGGPREGGPGRPPEGGSPPDPASGRYRIVNPRGRGSGGPATATQQPGPAAPGVGTPRPGRHASPGGHAGAPQGAAGVPGGHAPSATAGPYGSAASPGAASGSPRGRPAAGGRPAPGAAPGRATPPAGMPVAGGPPTPASATTPAPARAPGGRLARVGGVLGALGIPFLVVATFADHAADSPGLAAVLLFATGLGLSLSVVSATRRERGSRAAVVVAAVGLLGALVYGLSSWGGF